MRAAGVASQAPSTKPEPRLPQPLLPHWLEACCVSLWAMTARGPAHGREGFTVSLC